ncbi:MAG: SRPBCC family protein [Acidimicrobiales bacterium]
MQKTVHAEAIIPAPPEAVFACLADYKCAPIFIEGLEELSPTGARTTGEKAQFQAVLKVGPHTLRTTISITHLDPGRSVTWSSTGETAQSLHFELRPGPAGTGVALTVSYEEPGGLGAIFLAPFVASAVQHRTEGALSRIREHLVPS